MLLILYGMCFGIELTMNNVVVTYLFDQFDLDLTVAGVIGALFGLMNLFARSLGGFISDGLAKGLGMRGRIWALFITIALEGVFCIAMGWAYKCAREGLGGQVHRCFHTHPSSPAHRALTSPLTSPSFRSLPATIVLMVLFSSFVQASEGACYAIVPFVSKRSLGVVSGFVGAGGNLGSVFSQFLFFTKDSMATYVGIQYMGCASHKLHMPPPPPPAVS